MNRDSALYEYEFWTPQVPLEVTFSIHPDELEIAMATNGRSLREALMRAIIFALVSDGDTELH